MRKTTTAAGAALAAVVGLWAGTATADEPAAACARLPDLIAYEESPNPPPAIKVTVQQTLRGQDAKAMLLALGATAELADAAAELVMMTGEGQTAFLITVVGDGECLLNRDGTPAVTPITPQNAPAGGVAPQAWYNALLTAGLGGGQGI
jgi:hypothetical protein